MANRRSEDFEAALRGLGLDGLDAQGACGARTSRFLESLGDLGPEFEADRRARERVDARPRRRALRATVTTAVVILAVAAAAVGGMAYAAAHSVDPGPAPIATVVIQPPIDPYALSVLPIGGDVVDPAAKAAMDAVLQQYRDTKAKAAADAQAAADAAAAAAADAAAKAAASTSRSSGSTKPAGSTGGTTTVPAAPSIKSMNADAVSGSGTVDVEVYVTTTGGALPISASASIPGVGSVTLSGPASLNGSAWYRGTMSGIPAGSYTITIHVNDKTMHVNAPVF
jgi:hypothetical protein